MFSDFDIFFGRNIGLPEGICHKTDIWIPPHMVLYIETISCKWSNDFYSIQYTVLNMKSPQ